MLILFSSTFAIELEKLWNDPDLQECLDNVAIAHRKGIHVVSGPAPFLRFVCERLRGDAGGTFREVRQKFHEQAALVAIVAAYVVVEPRRDGGVRSELVAGRRVYRVPFSFFAKNTAIQPARLVAEDSNDCTVFLGALKAYVYDQRTALRGLSWSLQGFGGGGSSTEDQLRSRAADGPTIAVVDSDRCWPDGPFGGTALAVLRVASEIEHECVSHALVLESHELENLLPRSLVEDSLVAHDGSEMRERWLAICEAGLLGGACEVRFLDLKKGLRHRDLLLASHAHERAYRQAAATAFPLPSPACPGDPQCGRREDCRCIYFHGFDGDVLARVARKVEAMTQQKLCESFFSTANDNREVWLNLGKILFSWSCAAKKLRA